MNLYNEVQLRKDLEKIASIIGIRQPHGYFSATSYDDDIISITHDEFGCPTLESKGKFVDMAKLKMSSPIAQHVLFIVMTLEERLSRVVTINHADWSETYDSGI